MNVKIRNAVPDDAAAIQKIIAAGYRRSFAGLHSTEYLEQKIQEYLSPARIEKMANIIRNENSVNIVAENADGDVVGSVGGMRDENNNWELIALYVDENVIGDTKFALSLVQEFAKRVKDAGATTNPRKKHEYSSQKHKSTSNNHPRQKLPMGLRPVSGRPAQTATAKPVQKASTPITRPLNLDKTTPTITLEYDIKDLTPQMVEKILGVKWSQLCGKHFFYSFDNPLPQDVIINRELQRMNNKFEAHPMFQGRKMAFAAYGIAYYNGNKEYIEKPMLHDFSYGPTDPYCDMYGTFISYNPKTKLFEKYPRGWIKLKEDIDEYGYILSSSLSRDADKILSVYANQKQKTR